MKIYEIKSLDEIIKQLRALPKGSQVRGIHSGYIHSDRGYYDRNAITPDSSAIVLATVLADQLENAIGGSMEGWKGGEYTISGQKPVAYADYGDTGPYIAGFAEEFPGNYVPYGVYEGFWG